MSKFFKTTLVVTVLSENEPCTTEDLGRIYHEIMDGNWSGQVKSDDGVEITAQAAAAALIEQGSDPEFFQLDAHGLTEDDYKVYPIEDWKYEVANGDTKLGLIEWIRHQREMATERTGEVL